MRSLPADTETALGELVEAMAAVDNASLRHGGDAVPVAAPHAGTTFSPDTQQTLAHLGHYADALRDLIESHEATPVSRSTVTTSSRRLVSSDDTTDVVEFELRYERLQGGERSPTVWADSSPFRMTYDRQRAEITTVDILDDAILAEVASPLE